MRTLRDRTTLFVGTLLLAFAASVTAQQPLPPADPPPASAGPALPKADETNAERTKSQPGNNAPFWRSVRESGNQPGTIAVPGAGNGRS